MRILIDSTLVIAPSTSAGKPVVLEQETPLFTGQKRPATATVYRKALTTAQWNVLKAADTAAVRKAGYIDLPGGKRGKPAAVRLSLEDAVSAANKPAPATRKAPASRKA